MKSIKKLFLPAFVGFMYLFLYLPIFVMMIFSFNNSSLGYNWSGFTVQWYRDLLDSTEIIQVLKNSLFVAFSTVVLSLSMSIAIIWALFRKYSKLFIIFYMPIMIPEIVISVGLLSLFVFFHIPLGINTLIIGHTLLGIGFAFPIIYVRFNELDYRLIEASLDLGANLRQTFFKIVMPFLLPAIISASLLVFIISLDDFLISFFCSSSSSQTLSLYIYSTIRTGVSPLVNALSTAMFFTSSILVLIFIYISRKFIEEAE